MDGEEKADDVGDLWTAHINTSYRHFLMFVTEVSFLSSPPFPFCSLSEGASHRRTRLSRLDSWRVKRLGDGLASTTDPIPSSLPRANCANALTHSSTSSRRRSSPLSPS